MKKILIAILLAGFFSGCKKDVAIKPSEPIKPDYTLPQGKSPADNRIVELYKKYNTYFLYEYTVADFRWNQIGKRLGAFGSTNGNPLYVGDMLDFLQDKWFRFYPDEFLKTRMPYKIFLADSLYVDWGGGDKVLAYANSGAENLALGHVNAQLKGRDNEFKKIYKNQINLAFWDILLSKKSVELPESFFAGTIYNVNTNTNPTSPAYFKTRGFVDNFSSLEYYPIEDNKTTDIKMFIEKMFSLSKSEWDAQFLSYPLIKRKYDILQAHFLSRYNINLQLIGNAE